MRDIVTALALLVLLAGCGGGSGSGEPSTAAARSSEAATGDPSGSSTVTIESPGGEEVRVWAEIADEPAEQQRGLMGRESLGEDRGMLFVFPDEQVRSFWMKDTLIPLSIAYMDSGGRIVDIQSMKPLDDKPPHYVSSEPARYALEVNKGFFEEHGVEVGDRAELPH